MPSFNKRKFWSFISALKVCSNPKLEEIHNFTLHVIRLWIKITLFHGSNVNLISNIKMLYAMVNEIKISPVKSLIEFLAKFD